MEKDDLVVGIYNTHTEAEESVKKLEKAGFDMKRLSILGKDYHSEEHVVGYYNTGDRMKAWGKMGAFWGGLWGMLFGAAFFVIPGIGPIVVAGPFVSALVGALEGAVVVGGVLPVLADPVFEVPTCAGGSAVTVVGPGVPANPGSVG